MADDNNRPRRPGPPKRYNEEADDDDGDSDYEDTTSSRQGTRPIRRVNRRGQTGGTPASAPAPAPASAPAPAPGQGGLGGPGARVAAAIASYLPAGNPFALPPPSVAVNVFGTLPRLPNGSYPDRRINLNDLANMWWNQPGQDRTWPASDRCHYCASAKRNDCDVGTRGYPCTRCDNNNRPNCRNGSSSVGWEALRRQEDDDRVAAGLLQNNQRYNAGPVVYTNVNLNPFNYVPVAPSAPTTATRTTRVDNRRDTTTAGPSGTRNTESSSGTGTQPRGTKRTRTTRSRSPERGNANDGSIHPSRSPIKTRVHPHVQYNEDNEDEDRTLHHDDKRQRYTRSPPQSSIQDRPQDSPSNRAFENIDIVMAGMPGPPVPVSAVPSGPGAAAPPTISPLVALPHNPQNGHNATLSAKQESFLDPRRAFPNPGLGQGFGGNQGESSRRPDDDLNIAAQAWDPPPISQQPAAPRVALVPSNPIPYVAGNEYLAVDADTTHRLTSRAIIGRVTDPTNRPLQHWATYVFDGSDRETAGWFEWPFPGIDRIADTHDHSSFAGVENTLKCGEIAIIGNDPYDFQNPFRQCQRSPAKRCEYRNTGRGATPLSRIIHEVTPMCTCTFCRGKQMRYFAADHAELVDRTKNYLCGDCAAKAKTQGIAWNPLCICMASLQYRWLCLDHRYDTIKNNGLQFARAEEYLIRIGIMYGEELTKCTGCWQNSSDVTSGVYSCKLCRDFVLE